MGTTCGSNIKQSPSETQGPTQNQKETKSEALYFCHMLFFLGCALQSSLIFCPP